MIAFDPNTHKQLHSALLLWVLALIQLVPSILYCIFNPRIRIRPQRSMAAASPPQLRPSSSQPSLAQQQQQQLQDIKPGLLAQSLACRQQKFTYKDKFQSLRERYDQVSAVRPYLLNPPFCKNELPDSALRLSLSLSLSLWKANEALHKELALAQAKMHKLEAENKLRFSSSSPLPPDPTPTHAHLPRTHILLLLCCCIYLRARN
jgi:hypothetical protein